MIKNAKEIFRMLYDNEIKNDECIEVICEGEKNHFILRYNYGNSNYGNFFDNNELMSCLLFKEYNFKIIKQDDAIRRLDDERKEDRINQLENELKKLKGE